MLWLGAAVSPQILDDLWGVDSLEDVDLRMVSSCPTLGIPGQRAAIRTAAILTSQTQLPKLPTLLSTQVRNILTHFERVYGQSLPITIIRQNMDGMEIEFANALVEDSNNDALSYTDCTCLVSSSV
jgi:protein transport protein SEC24